MHKSGKKSYPPKGGHPGRGMMMSPPPGMPMMSKLPVTPKPSATPKKKARGKK